MTAYTNAIEPHTDYFGPRVAEAFDLSMSLSLDGIGCSLQVRDEVAVIREIVPGSPAALSGRLHVGDKILGVSQGASGPFTEITGWRLDDVIALIRGKSGNGAHARHDSQNSTTDSAFTRQTDLAAQHSGPVGAAIGQRIP